ncbi:MAG: hypothetical protein ACE145_06910 [Terriglobia bacterium]
MLRVERVLRSGVRAWSLMAVFGLVFGAPAVSAQFGLPKLPKVPKIGKQEQKPPAQAKQPQGPPPEVTAITPNTVPPGWEGDVVFTGKNFATNMLLRMYCQPSSVKERDFRVESAERAKFHLKVPDSAEESKCTIALEVPAPPTAETGPSVQGSPMVVQVTGVTFSISGSSGLPQAFKACFMAEGDLTPMELMSKMSEVMASGSQDECKLMVSSDSVKYSNQGKVVLDQPASAVKSVDTILFMGNPMGIFKIVTTGGKVYNFFASGGHNADNPVEEQIKKKLKK